MQSRSYLHECNRNRQKALEHIYFRLLARWVCDRTGVAELEAYVGEMIDIRMAGADVDGMIAKILADVRSPGKDLDEMLTASAMRDFASPP